MVENLNPISFAPYGRILTGPAVIQTDLPAPEHMSAASGRAFICYHGAEIQLARGAGMSVLEIYDKNKGGTRRFYLDRDVSLQAGIWFAVAAFDTHTLTPILTVTDIHTLFYQEREPNFFFAGEQHAPYELVYVDRGTLHSVAGGRDITLSQGEMMVYDANQWHMQYEAGRGTVCFITMAFDMLCACPEILTDRRIVIGADAREFLERMLTEQAKQDPLRDDMLLTGLQMLLLLITRQIQSTPPSARLVLPAAAAAERLAVEQAQKYISENVHKPLSVADAAQSVHLSASYMTALFRRHLHIAPACYIRRVRLSEAKRLLREANASITEAANSTGFATVQHFSRAFKTEYGVTPSDYARAIGK